MVTNTEIWTPTHDPQAEKLKADLIEEFYVFAKDAALRLGCDVEELKHTVNNKGQYNFQRMTPAEIAENEKQRIIEKRIKAIREARN